MTTDPERAERMKRGYGSYYLSRDMDAAGNLSKDVDVWLQRPEMIRLPGGGTCWLGPDDTGLQYRYATWTIAHCLLEARVYPETFLELILVGEPVIYEAGIS